MRIIESKKDILNLDIENKTCDCKARILVVDDNEFNIIPVNFLIKEYFNIDIEQCSNGAEAVILYKQGLQKKCKCIFRTYRLIFMDLNMPVMNG